MKAVILAAGVGSRLGSGRPKCLLRLGGRSLLERHLENLRQAGVGEVVLALGHQANRVRQEVERLAPRVPVRFVVNPRYREGSVVTLAAARAALEQGEPVLLMDADVLYDPAILERLVGTPYPDCVLADRAYEPGEEPVKARVRDERLVELRKQPDPGIEWEWEGESVGFFRLAPRSARELARICERHLRTGLASGPHEEALRELFLGCPEVPGGVPARVEDVTGLAWIEIDFPEDVRRAEEEILPRIEGRG